MSKLIPLNCQGSDKTIGYAFYCPGCKDSHVIYTDFPDRPSANWKFNGNMENPTFTPSLLCHASTGNPSRSRCHSFITDGKIQYLGDCEHDLRGQTVDIPSNAEDLFVI